MVFLKILGLVDLIGAVLILSLLASWNFPAFLFLIVSLVLIIKSGLNIFSLGGATDFLSGVVLLSSLFEVDLKDYYFLLLILVVSLFIKSLRSLLA